MVLCSSTTILHKLLASRDNPQDKHSGCSRFFFPNLSRTLYWLDMYVFYKQKNGIHFAFSSFCLSCLVIWRQYLEKKPSPISLQENCGVYTS